ncbi:hypothetical protein RB594_004797 [Gaeumannomyces avenae]
MRTQALPGLLLAGLCLLGACQPSTTSTQSGSTSTSWQDRGIGTHADLEDGSYLAKNSRHSDRNSQASSAALAAPGFGFRLPNLGSLIPQGPISDAEIMSLLPPPLGNDEPSDEGQQDDWTRRHKRAWELYHYLASWAAGHSRQGMGILLRFIEIIYPSFFTKATLLWFVVSPAGVAAESLPAWVQSIVGKVLRRILRAFVQSAGEGGYGAPYVVYLVRALWQSSLVHDMLEHFHMDAADLEALLTVFLNRWVGCDVSSKLECETYCVDCNALAVSPGTTCLDKL